MTSPSKLRVLAREFCSENFVFAVRYLADRRLTRIEKLWWTVWVLATLVTSCYYAASSIKAANDNPMVTVYASRFLPVSTVPFPAITICPLSKTHTKLFNLTRVLEQVKDNKTLDHDSELKLRTLAHVCPMSALWKQFEKSKHEKPFETLKQLTNLFHNMASLCRWKSRFVPCYRLLGESLVADGLCYVFNSLAANETYRTDQIAPDFLNLRNSATTSAWTREKGYRRTAGLKAYPYRPLSSGMDSGVMILLSLNKIDQDFACRGPYTGYKISIHAPDEFPMSEDKFLLMNPRHALTLNLKPKVLWTSRSLRYLPPEKRKCFFNEERSLRYFRNYNRYNCAAECISNYTFEKCGCVRFTMPRSADMKICDASQIECYRNASTTLNDEIKRHEIKHGEQNGCRCYQACNEFKYAVEISQFPFFFENYSRAAGFSTEDYSTIDPTVMFVSFKLRHYLPLWRRKFFGTTDAIAKFGGLFALLMGSSVMSLGEILYYCWVRPLRRERTAKQKKREQSVRLVLPWIPPNKHVFVARRWV
ncbi:pickpocket protein 28-like [Wyeomyia smithii]|uniref:pickpocket protein 28-like n=1 Tax=Wyeomyia smithii TaxID=174621 RepID=UPI002467F434|nr:pickpocket protein 28-like [Wyeomyia smithii]